ncbi:MAG TPA: cytochrome c oxidase assembly protein [Gaiellaceae bacterium]|nr:cytochrome c oxidase assembly protein [Gaiellaceae bacterium]
MAVVADPASWPLGAPFAVCAALALLYALGGRSHRPSRRRAASFYGGIATVVLALDTPVDAYADRLFAVHMLQHVLLLTVAPPLLVSGRPWPRLWQPLPLRVRRAGARAIAAAAPLATPPVALALLTATVGAWHVPALYDATLRSDAVHQLEHLSFVATAILFWAVMLGAPPLRARIDGARRCLYFVLAMVPGWILAIVLAFARTPLYAYAGLRHRPGGISGLADQQLAAGVMWVPGSVAYVVAACWSLYSWLEPRGGTRTWSPPAAT